MDSTTQSIFLSQQIHCIILSLYYCNRRSEHGIHSHTNRKIVSPHHYHKLKLRIKITNKRPKTLPPPPPVRCKSFIRSWMINVSILFFSAQIMAPRFLFWLDVVSILIPAIIIYFYFAVAMTVVLCSEKL